MSYIFFLVVGLVWGVFCGVSDARGFLRNDRTIMQLLCGLAGYGVAWVAFWGQPEGGLWLIHLIEVVTVSQILHTFTRSRLSRSS